MFILFCGVLTVCGPGVFRAEQNTRPAEFLIGQTVMNTNPAGFGAEFSHEQRINNWTDNPGMEPLSIQQYWEITGGGTDGNGDYAVCNTRKSDTLYSGFLDGAHYRLYRENMAEGRIEKIREGTIPAGGFVAAGYMQVGSSSSSILAYAPNSDATDDYLIENGETWYYAVKAYDTEGNWSGFSAAVPGATPQAGITNGPRIKTQTIANPTLGKTYLESSPLATLTVRGGTLPLSWAVVSGALPNGMTLSSAGKIYGTCSVSNEIAFVARVTDGASNTHDRTFTMFRPAPAGDGAAPSAPENVTVEALNGFVHIRWDPPAESDIRYYQIYRSRHPESQHMERIYLGGSGAVPAAADLLFVESEVLHAPPKATRSLRVLQYQGETGWIVKNSGTTTQEIVPHPGALPAQFMDEYPGEGCLKVSSGTSGSFGIFHYKADDTASDWWSVNQFPTGQTYRMECWVYGEGLTNNTLRFQFTNYTDQTVTEIVNGVWTKLSVDFAVTNWITNAVATFGPTFYFQGPGAVYIDNAVVYNINDPRGPCHFSQSVFDLWTDYVGPADFTQKGVMRVRYNTESFKHIMNPSVMSRRGWSRTNGADKEDPQHIHDALQEALETGTAPGTRTIPWIIASLEWSETDFVNLVEYLSGPAGTPYGDLRISQRGGVTNPWTDEFRKIFIEMGNEPWNTSYFFGFRGGFSEASGRTYGRWCNYIWDHVWTNSAYMTDRIKPVLGGWNAARSTNSFTYAARKECPRADHVSMTMYLGGWEAGQEGQIGGTTWSDDGVQQWPVFLDRAGADVINSSVKLQATMAAENLPFDWVVYEGGPSYLMDGLNGVSLTDEEQAVTRKYGRTQAAAIGALDYYMYGVYNNIRENAFFGFAQDRSLWASHTHVHRGYRPHPSFLTVTLYNHQISPASMLFSAPVSMPVFDLEYEKDGKTVIKPGMELASAYAFQDGGRYAVLLLNKKVDGVHNGYDFGDGSVPAAVHLPFSSPAAVTLYKISGDPRETNVDQLNFRIVTQAIDTVHFSREFTVNQNTGGTSNGLPTGAVFLYVFEGCTPDAVFNPEVLVIQAPSQPDPAAELPVEFTVFFSEPVTGFDAADIVQTGSAVAAQVTVEEMPGQQGAAYRVLCSRIVSTGDLTLQIPAAVAVSAATGRPNLASTNGWTHFAAADADSSVQILTAPLAEWNYDGESSPTPKDANWKAANVVSAVAATGPGLETADLTNAIRINRFTNSTTLAQAVANNDYFSVSLSPAAGKGLHLTEIYFYQFDTMETNETLWLHGRASTNSFATFTELGSFDGITGSYGNPSPVYLPVDVNTRAGEGIELRFYMVATNDSRYDAWGVGDTTVDGLVDLYVKGALTEPAPDTDGDGIPDWWETQYFGGATNANPGAAASNGINTVREAYIAGLDPAAPSAVFKISNFQPLLSGNILGWDTVSGRVYSVYWTSNLLNGFTPLETNFSGGTFTDPTHGAGEKGFYKIGVRLAP